MKRFALLPIVSFALLSACSETITNPTRMSPSEPQLAIIAANAPNGAHYRQNSGDPVCSITGLTVSCTGTQIAGVGNEDADVALTVAYAATVQCRNHGGQIVAVKTQGTTSTPAPDETTELRNGTLIVSSFSASNVPTAQTFQNLATCPNGNWTKELLGEATVVSFTYTLTFQSFAPDVAIVVTGP